ncbi:carboxylating nicotinate-nucleotide diphosphorylase [Heyndrickxia ginsengihumi]|uniref:Probable nicotinate-nucleotide pyrophosphorylase [carboxylating] n=1 Tax=Heyndrickxia ginsengihumi TaxID=363870 RepID=A0A0A6XWQ2_9BACI|nr:carboxylating nicotinate-nucleotide diphosphorylase [Heyndrickxia ginsengihumi]KHD84562.1 nicotinate-nucleotide pyrophosphorylase [Heyndrickxia ginsengihumi]MBE6183278.1 carboxylating nicotinate-nucleotide diphosphorylase [Bacillus sp. (in: firmicutes)]MCM3022984.1 carboxylating nicotinate-nucleotide diphosphorylase [Heyndrickxia ginsengihumi]NEY19455.1 carboxylating nicotinate-nucleotide diphosphorylase [Heyndrickxia ginsengihumi]
MNNIKLHSMLKQFLIEDIGDGDINSEFIFPPEQQGVLTFIAKADGIFCGKSIIEEGFHLMNENINVRVFLNDGEPIYKGDTLAEIQGPIANLLATERVVLNLIQRMSGIATITNEAVLQTEGTAAKICDTRKTTPGLRMLEKYAVKCGGGFNHRRGLYDAVMLKDNHIAFAGSIENAIRTVKEHIGHTVKIEVEIETKEQLLEAIDANVDIIMFDNRTPEEIKAWISLVPSHIATEASGGITLNNINDYAQTGVDWISLGFLTHSVKALDISAIVQNN